MTTPPPYVPASCVFHHANILRKQLGLPAYRSQTSIGAVLRAKKIPNIPNGARNKLWHLPSALQACTQLQPTRQPWNRPATQTELDSREYMPMTDACQAFRCSMARLLNAVHTLAVKALRHPITARLWVNIAQAQEFAAYRSLRFLRRVLPPDRVAFIQATRPRHIFTTQQGFHSVSYFVPELSHLGSKITAYTTK